MNHSKQIEIPYPPQAVKDVEFLEEAYLLGCDSFGSAVRIGVSQSNNVHTLNELADCLNMGYSHFNATLNPKENKNFNPDRIDEMESFLGNHAVSQYLELQAKRKLYKFRKIPLVAAKSEPTIDMFKEA